MKQSVRGVLFFSLFLLCLFSFGRGRAVIAAQPADSRLLRVAVYQCYPVIYEENSRATGFQLEMLKEIAGREGWKLEFLFPGSLKNVLQSLEMGTVDIAMGLVPTEERRNRFLFTSEQNALVQGRIFVARHRYDIRILNDLQGKKIGFISRGALGTTVPEVLRQFGIAAEFTGTHSYDELALAIRTGTVDAGLFYSDQGRYLARTYAMEATNIVFKPQEMQYAVVRGGGNESIVAAIDRYLRKWKPAPGSPYKKLEQEFLLVSTAPSPAERKREMMIAGSVCVLFILFGLMLGSIMADGIETRKQRPMSTGYLGRLLVFATMLAVSFWFLDAIVSWLFFNTEPHRTLLQLTLTDIPRANLYVRLVFALVCGFFAMFQARALRKYEAAFNLMYINMGRFEQLVNNAGVMMFRMSLPDGNYEFVNKAAFDISGYSPEEFYRRPNLMMEIAAPDWEVYCAREWQKIVAGKDFSETLQFEIRSKPGRLKKITQRNTLYFDKEGTPVALEGVVADVGS